MVARAAPDGRTLLFNNNAIVILPHVRKVNYDLRTDLVPVCNTASTPTVMVVNANSPYRTLQDIVTAARAKPGELTYGSAPAGLMNVAFEMMAHQGGFKATFVPFGGTPPALNAVLGEHITIGFVDYPAAAGHIQAGKLRAVAVGSRTRIPELPDVPTIAESGFKDYEIEVWYAVFAPAKTPGDVMSRVSGWFRDASLSPAIRGKLTARRSTRSANAAPSSPPISSRKTTSSAARCATPTSSSSDPDLPRENRMPRYIALLRAVNVGGTGALPMAKLKSMCLDAGFTRVETYIASGNVVFDSKAAAKRVKAELESRLHAHASKPVGVIVRTAAEMADVLEANPFRKTEPKYTYVVFLDARPPRDALERAVGVNGEEMALGRREISFTTRTGWAARGCAFRRPRAARRATEHGRPAGRARASRAVTNGHSDLATVAIVVAGALVAGFTTGFAGFGTGLVASGFWFHVLPAAMVPPLVALASVAGQIVGVVTVRKAFDWARLRPF